MIREAEAKDKEQLLLLYRMLVPNSRRVNVMEEQIELVRRDPRNFILVFEEQDKLLGTLTLNICLQVMQGNQPYAIIENIVVDEEARGKGIGQKLIEYTEQYCRSLKCRKIMLLSASARTGAHRFFEREGFSGSVSKGFKKYLND